MNEHFHVDADGALARTVVPGRSRVVGEPPGEPYVHRCPLATLTAVAHAIDEKGAGTLFLEDLVAATGLPHSQVNVALAFFKERGSIVPGGNKRHVRAVGDVYLDAMTEYHALREKGPVA